MPPRRGATIAFEEYFHEAEPSALHAVASRPEICRGTVLAHYLNGFSYERVADCLGVPLTTVNFRLHRAHLEVRRHFSSDGAGELDTNAGNVSAKVEAAIAQVAREEMDERLNPLVRLRSQRSAPCLQRRPDQLEERAIAPYRDML